MTGGDRPGLPYAISALTGLLLWGMTALAGGRVEPWDAAVYWTVAYPASVLLAGLLGLAFPRRSWRWAAILIFMQVPVMLAAGSSLGLLPLGMFLLAILTVPAMLAAALGSRIALWRGA